MKRFLFLLQLIGCTIETPLGTTDPIRTQVALVPQTTSNDVDVLFVVDDSPNTAELQIALQQAFPAFLETLGPQLPSMHIGVVSTDLGTKGANDQAPGPGIGAGPGSCAYKGKDALLQGSAALASVPFIIDRDNSGVHETNYTGTLAEAFTSISALGSNGCGFEQPLEAAKRAFEQTSNSGFVRPNARLAVIIVTDEDDCSVSHSTLLGSDTLTLGPLQSFRCTRFGVICDDDGTTTDAMNKVGKKAGCHANPSTQYLTSVADTAAFIKSVKDDGRNVVFGAIAGVSSSLEVELRTPPGGGTAIPALRAECTWPSTNGTVIEPGIRITDAANAFARHYVQMACGLDMTAPAIGIAREIRGMLGDSCVTRNIASPTDCEAFDVRGDGSERPLPKCSTSTSDCFRFVQDGSCGGGLRVEIVRSTVPPTDTMVSVRCR